jgi:3-methylcrotonyl-CoA carboxylase alpha subunit
MRRRFEIDGLVIEAALTRHGNGYALQMAGDMQRIELSEPGPDAAQTLRAGGRAWPIHIARDDDKTFIQVAGRSFTVRIVEPLTAFADADAGKSDLTARAPMPGTIVSVRTKPGARVSKGEILMVIESMKLETAITASRDGVVETIHLAAGDTFDRDAPLVSLTTEAAG